MILEAHIYIHQKICLSSSNYFDFHFVDLIITFKAQPS